MHLGRGSLEVAVKYMVVIAGILTATAGFMSLGGITTRAITTILLGYVPFVFGITFIVIRVVFRLFPRGSRANPTSLAGAMLITAYAALTLLEIQILAGLPHLLLLVGSLLILADLINAHFN